MAAEVLPPIATEPDASLILESITDGVHVFDASGRITLINQTARDLHRERGCDPGQLLGKRVFTECFPELRHDTWGRALTKAMSERVTVEVEYYYSSWKKWYNSRFFPVSGGGVVVFCRDITEKKIARQQLQISHAVTSALAQSKSINDAAPLILKEVCDATDAELAALWERNTESNQLRCIEAFACSKDREGEFLRKTCELRFSYGQGLPGTAWKERRAIWIPDVTVAQNFARAALASAEHLHGAFAVPIIVGEECYGVLEFFLSHVREPDQSLLQLLEVISLQIAQFIQRTQAESAFHESEDRFQMLANNVSQLAWIADAKGLITWYNQRWFDYTGTTLEEMRGWGWTKVHHPDHVDRVVKRIQLSWDSGAPWEDTFPLRGKDGAYRWFLSRALPIRNQRGEVVRWFGTNTDITELLETQEALRLSEQRFRLMADATSALIWMARDATNRVWFNRAWLDFVGQPMESEIGLAWTRHIHPEDLATCLRAFERAFTSGGPLEIEYRLQRHDGVYRWMLVRSAGNPQSVPGFNGFVGCCIDVTDNRNRTEELEHLVAERTARLRESIHDLETLSYGIIHDLRGPLRSMHSWSEFLLEEVSADVSDEARACIQRILASSKRMDQLVKDVLDYGRILRAEPRLVPVNTTQLITSILDSYPELAAQKARIEIIGSIPPVLGTDTAVTQCLSNLLRNAVKFVPPHRTPHVRVWAEEITATPPTSPKPAPQVQPTSQSMVRIWVEDNGIGIPREFWDRIFQMFQRLDNKTEGTGIGLAIVKKSVERLGGRVGLQSEPGHGSRFWIELPAVPHTRTNSQSKPVFTTHPPNHPVSI